MISREGVGDRTLIFLRSLDFLLRDDVNGDFFVGFPQACGKVAAD